MSDNTYTVRMQKQLIDKINELSPTEHEEIFKIIRDNSDCNYTQNLNGVFFNMANLSDVLISKIDSFVLFCIENNKELEQYDKKLKECKIVTSESKDAKVDEKVKNNINSYTENANEDSRLFEDFIDSNEHGLKVVKSLYSNIDRCPKKKVYTKYHAARKKYSKKVPYEKKTCFDVLDNLEKMI